ncbi:GNAT family N-acetyltransferase [Arsenicicoccus sp. oral taxon 190]|uniref:GNAT family N-acetyltransferase n=1 Tax=Arsenicicoccus sp. oral taxon 190 TaxID=1658671 RepID=UPI00067A32DF|nr:GNAT family N-acetyltransferase [Arsenicicoccus sp. oral taxon 190]AKT50739.1 hypothetical protein ADJ73_04400 [Arsenicicoccus sp. oral taxon 190]
MTITIRRATTPDELAGARELLLTSFRDDQGYGFQPQWHWDVEHLREVYVDNPRQALLVAVDEETGAVVGTCAARVGGPASPPHPEWLAARYADRAAVAQLVRLVTDPRHRRHGLGRRLVEATVDLVRDEGGYRVIYLHTNAKFPGALEFWRGVGMVEVHDARGEEDDDRFETVHFELPLR